MAANESNEWKLLGKGGFGCIWTQKKSPIVVKHFILNSELEEKAEDLSDEWAPLLPREQRHALELAGYDHIENWMGETLHRSILSATRGICAMVSFDHRNLTLTLERYKGIITHYIPFKNGKAAELRIRYQEFLLDTVLPQVCEQLAAIHAQGFVHLDIKPDNILYRLEEGKCRIALTDLVCTLCRGKVFTGKTTPGYIPDIDLDLLVSYPLDYRYDMYSLGKTLLNLASKQFITKDQYLPRFAAVIEQLTGDYQAIPPPQTYAPVTALTLCDSMPYVPIMSGHHHTLAFTLFAYLGPKYGREELVTAVCTCIQLLVQSKGSTHLLERWMPSERPLLDSQMLEFLDLFTLVLNDAQALSIIRCFVESRCVD